MVLEYSRGAEYKDKMRCLVDVLMKGEEIIHHGSTREHEVLMQNTYRILKPHQLNFAKCSNKGRIHL